jgi:hypothetical protein
MNRKLLVLDLSGLLCHKCAKGILKLRPHHKEFLEYCYASYDVGFMSSTMPDKVSHIISLILTKEQYKQTIFIWSRDRVHLDPAFGLDPVTKGYDTIKRLSDLWDNPLINKDRIYNQTNTLICDDTPSKVRYNNQTNTLIFDSYGGDPEDNELAKISLRIESKFETLRMNIRF